ncbi:kinase-like domain-containing protein [Dendryphion nanum]|uniref:Kinase-like domain-containing protein n=1 Tax=Dendryphion nanum TaxID=256645 RepID=A0A9P9IAJ8_9PLEO|nr:kinase-like domain-containing protein [Dendryphion nanum]
MAANQAPVYHYIDATDQALYNGFRNQYQRAALIALMHKIRTSGHVRDVIPTTGAEVLAYWSRRKSLWIKNMRAISTANFVAPQAVAQAQPIVPPPAVPQPAGQGGTAAAAAMAAMAAAATATAAAARARAAAAEATAAAAAAAAANTYQGELSPTLVLINDPDNGHPISPTRGQRGYIIDYLRSISQGNAEGSWKFAKMIYQTPIQRTDRGRYQHGYPSRGVMLFVLVDHGGRIRERIAIKCIDLPPGPTAYISDREIQISRRLAKFRCRNILRYRGSSVRRKQMQLNSGSSQTYDISMLYTEYAKFGDLTSLIKHYRSQKLSFPEHFILHTLRGLLHALNVLHTQACDEPNPLDDTPQQESSENQNRVWHMDVKNDNIFLGAPDARSTFKYTETPLLADFDCSMELPLNEDEMDENYPGQRIVDRQRLLHFEFGTEGWFPPERGPGIQRHATYTHTSDTFQAGLVALSMTMTTKPAGQLFRQLESYRDSTMNANGEFIYDREKARTNPDLHVTLYDKFGLDELGDEYSMALYAIIRECLYYSTRRAAIPQLLVVIDRHLEKLQVRYGAMINPENEDDIPSFLQVQFPPNDDGVSRVDIYQPQTKRRINAGNPLVREQDIAAQRQAYDVAVKDWRQIRQQYWNNANQSAAPDWTAHLAAVNHWNHVMTVDQESRNNRLPPGADNSYLKVYDLATEGLRACLNRQVYKLKVDSGVSATAGPIVDLIQRANFDGFDDREVNAAFSDGHKQEIMRESIQSLQGYANVHPDEEVHPLQEILQNALEWGAAYHRLSGEVGPSERLEQQSIFHDAMMDFFFLQRRSRLLAQLGPES